ncbi:NAD-dependent histone deacetylase HST4 [Nakaseomyces bracarensis]|uniref:NAD-dependent histone deacetylase HST4 n=1 Tax=Nakaseomyces bracarensis TaxID=273131 RepID=UPI00387213B8
MPMTSVNLPLTPPSSTKKSVRNDDTTKVAPKRLISQLKRSVRKPRLKYRPTKYSVFSLDDYVDGHKGSKCREEDAEFLRYTLRYSKKMIGVVGAGISVAAGIPDFRSSDGLFNTMKSETLSSGKESFDFNKVYASDERSNIFHDMIVNLHQLSNKSEPTSFHKMLDKLAGEDRLMRLYTQNIDGLDTRLTHLTTKTPLQKPIPRTIQLHGSVEYMECNMCSKLEKFNPVIFQSEEEIVPSCPQCKEFEEVRSIAGLRPKGIGKLRPRVVLYNEVHPEGEMIGDIATNDLKKRIDCLIIAGTSLKIPGVIQMCKRFIEKIQVTNGIVIYMNKDMPSQSLLNTLGHIDLIVLGDCQNVPKLVDC